MCGIVGAAARRDIVPVLIEGLKRLEYRGYDSCGVAVLNGSSIGRLRSVERVADLVKQVRGKKVHGVTGIAHASEIGVRDLPACLGHSFGKLRCCRALRVA